MVEHMFESVKQVEREDPAVLAAAVFALTDEEVQELSLGAAEAYVLASQRAINALSARQAAAMEQVVTRCEERVEADCADAAAVGARLPHIGGDDIAIASLAPLLHISPRTMSHRVRRARQVVCLLPEVHEAAVAGDLEPYRVEAIGREADRVPMDRMHEFEARLLATDITHLTGSALRRRARRCAEKCTGADEEAVAEFARARRDVRLVPGRSTGMTTLLADLPTPTATRLWSAMDALASEYLRAKPGQRVGAARADAFIDLIEANATISTSIELVAPVDSYTPTHPRLGGPVHDGKARVPRPVRETPTPPQAKPTHRCEDQRHDPECEELQARGGTCVGHECESLPDGRLHIEGSAMWFVSGPASAPGDSSLLPHDIVALLNDPDTAVRLARTDGYTGAVRWQDPTTYRPGARAARAVRSRDGTCRFPGCATPAHRCHLDHVIAYPTGLTTVANLQALCATHHGFKHHAGWTVSMTQEGVCTWTAPDGRAHVTVPFDRHGTAPAIAAVA
jgi:hypothetical protein